MCKNCNPSPSKKNNNKKTKAVQHYIEDNDVDPRQCNRNVQKEPWCMKVCVYEIVQLSAQ